MPLESNGAEGTRSIRQQLFSTLLCRDRSSTAERRKFSMNFSILAQVSVIFLDEVSESFHQRSRLGNFICCIALLSFLLLLVG